MASTDFETTVKQEQAYLRKVHPIPDDIPGCMKAFDAVISCHALGSQFKSLYRYGHMSECGQKIEEFKYCLTVASMHPEERREEWIRRRAEWWAHRRLTKSSEDVWDIRTEPLMGWPPKSPNITGSTIE